MQILRGVRPLDVVLTALLAALAAYLGVENVNAAAHADTAHPLTSHSALIVPVFVLAVLPILLRRTAVIPALAVSTVLIGASLPAFGWVVRCGFGLPLSFAFAYAVARFAADRTSRVVGAVLVVVLQLVVLVLDSATGGLVPPTGGVDALVLAVPVAAVCWIAGAIVAGLVRRRAAVPTLAPEHANA